MPALADGEFATFLARVTGGTAGRAVIAGKLAGEPVESEVLIPETPPDPEADAFIPLLWARRRIRDLEEGETARHHRGSRQESRRRPRLTDELVELGTRFGLVSSETSYVIVEERADGEKATIRAELRRVPESLTRGWGGGTVNLGMAAPALQSMEDPGVVRHYRSARRKSVESLCFDRETSLGMPASAPAEPAADMRTVFFHQNADGSWDLSAFLAAECGADLEALHRATGDLGVPNAARILATLIALHLADQLPWRQRRPLKPMLSKAKGWLKQATKGVPEPKGGWDKWAASLLP
jgi:hypothetical protein